MPQGMLSLVDFFWGGGALWGHGAQTAACKGVQGAIPRGQPMQTRVSYGRQ